MFIYVYKESKQKGTERSKLLRSSKYNYFYI